MADASNDVDLSNLALVKPFENTAGHLMRFAGPGSEAPVIVKTLPKGSHEHSQPTEFARSWHWHEYQGLKVEIEDAIVGGHAL